MNNLSVLTVVFFLLIAAVLALFTYVGAFHPTEISIGKTSFRQLHVRYKLHVCAYVGNVATYTNEMIEELRLDARERRSVRIFYIYYDNPRNVREKYGTDSLCRWLIGVVMDDEERKLLTTEGFTSLEKELHEKNYKPFCIKGGDVVRTVFPLKLNKNVRALNHTIRVQQVFPLLKRFLVSQGVKEHYVCELYYNGVCETVMPLSKDHSRTWLVDEAHDVRPEKIFADMQMKLLAEQQRL